MRRWREGKSKKSGIFFFGSMLVFSYAFGGLTSHAKLVVLLFMLVCSSIFADPQFDPSKLISKRSIWISNDIYKGEHYNEIIYENKVVFHILERFMPIFESMLQEATSRNTTLGYKNNGKSLFSSAESIKDNFYINDNPRYLITEHPDNIRLKKEERLFKDDFFLAFKCDNKIFYKVSEPMFKHLHILKTTAINQGCRLQIDLKATLDYPSSDTKLGLNDCSWIVEEPSLDEEDAPQFLAGQKERLPL